MGTSVVATTSPCGGGEATREQQGHRRAGPQRRGGGAGISLCQRHQRCGGWGRDLDVPQPSSSRREEPAFQVLRLTPRVAHLRRGPRAPGSASRRGCGPASRTEAAFHGLLPLCADALQHSPSLTESPGDLPEWKSPRCRSLAEPSSLLAAAPEECADCPQAPQLWVETLSVSCSVFFQTIGIHPDNGPP